MNENKFNESRECYCDMYGDYERRKCNVCADQQNIILVKRAPKVKPKKKQRKK